MKLDEICVKCKRKSRLYDKFCEGLPDGAYFIGACEVEKHKAKEKRLEVADKAEATTK